MDHLQLDRLAEHIENAFDEGLPFSSGELSPEQIEVLGQVFGNEGYQAYLQDQVDRQIIKDFTLNAVMLGFLSEPELDGVLQQAATLEGRATLGLHMLMCSVEQAAELASPQEPELLKKLNPGLNLPSYIKLIDN